MQTTILKKDFINALTIGGAMVGNGNVLPILDNVKIDIKLDGFSVQSSNGENWVIKKSEIVSTDSEYSFVVDAGVLVKVLKSLIEEEVTIRVDNSRLIIEHFKGVIEMPISSSDLFPNQQSISDGVELVLDVDTLSTWVDMASAFVANDDLRPVMCGMYLYGRDGKLGMCASDGTKLFHDSISYDGEDFAVVLPSRCFKVLLNVLKSDKVTMRVNQNSALFIANDSELYCRLIDLKFPDFNRVIPKNNDINVNVNKSELLDSVNRASLMSNKLTSMLKLSISDSIMNIEGSDLDFSTKADEKVDVTKDGNDITIGVKGAFFLDCLNVISSENVVLSFSQPSRPILFGDTLNDNKIVLLMPMLLNQ